jgi:hypothetical protein
MYHRSLVQVGHGPEKKLSQSLSNVIFRASLGVWLLGLLRSHLANSEILATRLDISLSQIFFLEGVSKRLFQGFYRKYGLMIRAAA